MAEINKVQNILDTFEKTKHIELKDLTVKQLIENIRVFKVTGGCGMTFERYDTVLHSSFSCAQLMDELRSRKNADVLTEHPVLVLEQRSSQSHLSMTPAGYTYTLFNETYREKVISGMPTSSPANAFIGHLTDLISYTGRWNEVTHLPEPVFDLRDEDNATEMGYYPVFFPEIIQAIGEKSAYETRVTAAKVVKGAYDTKDKNKNAWKKIVEPLGKYLRTDKQGVYISFPSRKKFPTVSTIDAFYRQLNRHRSKRGMNSEKVDANTCGYYMYSMSKSVETTWFGVVDILEILNQLQSKFIRITEFTKKLTANIARSLVSHNISVFVTDPHYPEYVEGRIGIFNSAKSKLPDECVNLIDLRSCPPEIGQKNQVTYLTQVKKMGAKDIAFSYLDSQLTDLGLKNNFIVRPSIHAHTGQVLLVSTKLATRYGLESIDLLVAAKRALLANFMKTQFPFTRVPFITRENFTFECAHKIIYVCNRQFAKEGQYVDDFVMIDEEERQVESKTYIVVNQALEKAEYDDLTVILQDDAAIELFLREYFTYKYDLFGHQDYPDPTHSRDEVVKRHNALLMNANYAHLFREKDVIANEAYEFMQEKRKMSNGDEIDDQDQVDEDEGHDENSYNEDDIHYQDRDEYINSNALGIL